LATQRLFTHLQAVTHPCTNRAQCRVTTLIEPARYHLAKPSTVNILNFDVRPSRLSSNKR